MHGNCGDNLRNEVAIKLRRIVAAAAIWEKHPRIITPCPALTAHDDAGDRIQHLQVHAQRRVSSLSAHVGRSIHVYVG